VPPRHLAPAGAAQIGEQSQRGQHRVVGVGGAELQRCDQVGGELPQRPPALGGAQQRVLLGEVGQFRHLAAHP
jgi:hypothetical protein